MDEIFEQLSASQAAKGVDPHIDRIAPLRLTAAEKVAG
jgi:hypothetical protein